MGLGETLHALEGQLMQFQLQVECLGDRGVCDIIVSVKGAYVLAAGFYEASRCLRIVGVDVLLLDAEKLGTGLYARGPNAAAGDDEVIAGAHASYGFYYILFIVGDDLDSLQFDAEREAELG